MNPMLEAVKWLTKYPELTMKASRQMAMCPKCTPIGGACERHKNYINMLLECMKQ